MDYETLNTAKRLLRGVFNTTLSDSKLLLYELAGERPMSVMRCFWGGMSLRIKTFRAQYTFISPTSRSRIWKIKGLL